MDKAHNNDTTGIIRNKAYEITERERILRFHKDIRYRLDNQTDEHQKEAPAHAPVAFRFTSSKIEPKKKDAQENRTY